LRASQPGTRAKLAVRTDLNPIARHGKLNFFMIIRQRIYWSILVCAVLISVWYSLASCTEDHARLAEEGEQLARIRCASCHAYPDPGLLPLDIWKETVLPRMGHQMGIYADTKTRATLIEPGLGGQVVEQAGVFPLKPTISEREWKAIQAFYLSRAPEALTLKNGAPVDTLLHRFEVKIPDWRIAPPSTTMVSIRPEGGLYLGDANKKRLYWLDQDLRIEKAANFAEGIVHLDHQAGGLFITMMGTFSPTDAPSGAAIYMPDGGSTAQIILEGLQRPVHTAWVDVQGDGLLDAVVCAFGKWTGSLSVYTQQKDGRFINTVLRDKPGALQCYVRDLNNDGHPDILALFGQGDEGVFQYMNNGKGEFTEKRLLSFPPSWGSSRFRLADMNADGREDILYVCGDNADYRPILKPYHGVRIYLSDGRGGYEESFFYQLYGAYDAIPADFDMDGDIDLAMISFFPEYSARPVRAFVYLENTENGYAAHTFPDETMGRWIVMDAGDVDGDGDLDLVLGSLAFEVVPDKGEVARWVKEGIPFVLLENTTRR